MSPDRPNTSIHVGSSPIKRYLTAPVPLWTLVLLAVFSISVIAAVKNQPAEKQQVTVASTTTRAPAATAPAPTTTTIGRVSEPVTVLDISGANDTTSDNFSVSGKWTITVTCEGGAGVATEIIDASSQESLDYVNFNTPCGSSAQRSTGVLFLRVAAFGEVRWHIVVTDEPG